MSENNNIYSYEKLSETMQICVSDEHRFGTDAFLLADFAMPRHKDMVCDLCSGSGIVALLMEKNFKPKNILAVEIQQKAVEQIKLSLEKSGITDIVPIKADLKEKWEGKPQGTLDVVTCNPPYKLNNTGAKNDADAVTIARHEVMCSIDDVCKASSDMLKYGGRLCICNRPERLSDVIIAMKNNGIEPKRIRFVSKTPETAPWLFLIEGRKGGNPFLSVEKQLFVYNGNDFSDEMLRIYGKVVK